jgi:diaminopimelate epimerase
MIDGVADAFMRIYNADGTEASACGNAARCVAALLMSERNNSHIRLATVSNVLECCNDKDGLVTVDMGLVRLDWTEIPLAERCDTLHLPIAAGPFADPVAVNIGNPHAVFFVNASNNESTESTELGSIAEFGSLLEHHPLFPERANIGVAQVLARDRLRLKIWERGSGITLACGTGACAAVVASHRRGLTDRLATVVLDGGTLTIEWCVNDHVLMTGPATISFIGALPETLLFGV